MFFSEKPAQNPVLDIQIILHIQIIKTYFYMRIAEIDS